MFTCTIPWQQVLQGGEQMTVNNEEPVKKRTPLRNKAANQECGVVWFGFVPPDQFFEMTPFFLSLQHVRLDETAHRLSLDIHFFRDGPNAGIGFVCLDTQQAARDLVRQFPCTVMVGQTARFPIELQLSSLQDLELARQNYKGQDEGGHPRTPEPPAMPDFDDRVAAKAKEVWEEGKIQIVWLRGLPFETTEEDLKAFLKKVEGRYSHLEMGRLSTGECNGNAFMEVKSAADLFALKYYLHYKFFTIESHRSLPPYERPKPRFVEVIASNAQKRAESLRTERADSPPQQPQKQQGKEMQRDAPSTTATATATTAAAVADNASSGAPTTPAASIRTRKGNVPIEDSAEGLSHAPVARRQTPPSQAFVQQQQQHHQPQLQQLQPTFTFSTSSIAQQPFNTVRMYSQTSPAVPAAFQQQRPQQQQQQQQQIAVPLQNLPQFQYLQQQQQPSFRQETQRQCVLLLQGPGLNPQQVLMNSGAFTQLNMALNPTPGSTISVLSMSPSNGQFNGNLTNSNVVRQQPQTFVPAQFSFLPTAPVPQQPQPQRQPQQSFIIASNGQERYHLQATPNFYFASSN